MDKKNEAKGYDEKILVRNEKYSLNFLRIDRGFQSDLHYHSLKDLTVYVITGIIELEAGDSVYILKATEKFRIYPNVVYRVKSISSVSTVYEISTADYDADGTALEDAKKLTEKEMHDLMDRYNSYCKKA